ncbi:MAG: hypothetical protein FJ088_02060 [Deltaproteobacteria bacterium]|nr:hypothetical protein [Deltaproteobacteria bacterium]
MTTLFLIFSFDPCFAEDLTFGRTLYRVNLIIVNNVDKPNILILTPRVQFSLVGEGQQDLQSFIPVPDRRNLLINLQASSSKEITFFAICNDPQKKLIETNKPSLPYLIKNETIPYDPKMNPLIFKKGKLSVKTIFAKMELNEHYEKCPCTVSEIKASEMMSDESGKIPSAKFLELLLNPESYCAQDPKARHTGFIHPDGFWEDVVSTGKKTFRFHSWSPCVK